MHAAAQDAVIAFLTDPANERGAEPVKVIRTHISVVVLNGDRAYKLKRAVRLPYTDFSTADLRLATCKAEFALNTPTAPSLYLGVRRITRAAGGGLEFDGPGALVDAVVEMVRFDERDLFDRLAEGGALTPGLMATLAHGIAQFHAEAPVIRAGGGAENMAGVLDINRAGFATGEVFGEAEVAAFDAAFRQRLERHAAVLDAREARGLVRRCHGDLHLRNICLFDGRPTLFDCIDFNDQIATVDVLYDLAFLLMDLWHRNLGGLANLVANRYFDEIGEDAGYELLPFFMAVRAAVRAHVTGTFAKDCGADAPRQAAIAREYFDLALELLDAEPCGVTAIGGFSGSGKTTIAETLAPRMPPPPGARVVESDRTRKAMFGVPAETPLPPEAYDAEVSDEVYGRLAARSRALVEAGASVVVDAVFDRSDRRAALAEALCGHRFAGFWLAADPDVLRHRIEVRPKGPSDATVEVLEAQLARATGSVEWSAIPSEQSAEEVVQAMLAGCLQGR
ncbi:bifunctional aminoglycoside phosphotransferase/ATP-binding protein [Tropicimonas aquimaris]|uniref:AAA family ATPase n=1 Tax=Tropicimonas aquimaris TaxID=914152 RepID=A0ABW3IMZ5_9RHOB